LPRIRSNEIEIEYDTFGETGEPLVLIMGLGAQMVAWSEEFCARFVPLGYRVIRFDNRDVGLSTKFTHLGVPNISKLTLARRLGLPVRSPYTLEDMAQDVVGLIDGLALGPVHLVGVSMGGMVAQQVAVDAPDRVRSLCSWMSATGDARGAWPSLAVLRALLRRPPRDRASRIEFGVEVMRITGSPPPLFDEARTRSRIALAYDRSAYNQGFSRQLAAILSSSDRRSGLSRLRVPALVMHGERDPLIPIEGGWATAESIPGSIFEAFEGVGHDIPRPLWSRYIAAIDRNARRA
jgi:pimeloyl-ACP methyl ester carboxylesterase